VDGQRCDGGGAIALPPSFLLVERSARRIQLESDRGVVVELLEPKSQIEFSGGEIAGGDEAEDGVLDFGGEFGEGVAGAGTGDGVELVEADLVVEGERALRGEGEGLAGTGGEGGVEMGRDVLWSVAHEDPAGDGLQGGELRGAQVLGDIDGAGVDKLLKAKAGSGLGDRSRRGEILLLSTNGHDTTLPDVSGTAAYVRVFIGR